MVSDSKEEDGDTAGESLQRVSTSCSLCDCALVQAKKAKLSGGYTTGVHQGWT